MNPLMSGPRCSMLSPETGLPGSRLSGDESTPAVDRPDQAALSEHFHRPPDGPVGNLIVLSEIPFRPQPGTGGKLSRGDARGDVLSHAHVGQFGITAARRLEVTHSSKIAPLTCGNDSGSYYNAI
jgi:hypothetical protein